MITLVILFGITAIIYYFCARIQCDRNAQLNALMERHLIEAADLVEHCEALELYNSYLEAERCHYRAILALSMLRLPTSLGATLTGEIGKMTVGDNAP